MRTPKQLEEWSFSTANSDNIKNKIGDETLVEEEDNFTEKSCLETSSIDDLSTICSSSCSTQNINGSLKQSLKKLQKIQTINFDHKSEIQEIKQNFQKLFEENIKQLKVEKDISLKQKDEKINSLEEEINKLHNQGDDLIKLQTNFNNLELKFIEEKEKNVNLEKKNVFLENELKQIDKKIQKNDENSIQLNDENIRKDEKINCLEVEIKKANDFIDIKFGDLFNFNNLNSVVSLLNNLVFVKVKNKWKEINGKCCANKCINTNNPNGNCIEANGYVNLIDEENIKYFVGKRGYDQDVVVYTENPFKKPQNCLNYFLYYFEVKCIFEKELNGSNLYMTIGLKNCSTNNIIFYYAKYGTIYKGGVQFHHSTFSWNNNDIIGCGLVYPPTNRTNEFPYVFFTQNGKQIGKAVLLKENNESYKLYIWLRFCSVEANFGNDLEAKPFKYDISNHLILKEFY